MSSSSFRRPMTPKASDTNLRLPRSKSPNTLAQSDSNHRSVSPSRVASSKLTKSQKVATPTRIKFSTQMQQLSKDLQTSKSKLCSCLQIYSMLQSTVQGQRCLQHNNSLSLYCLNERRILCVNCLYGMHRHRSHKVIPLRDCMGQVYEDNKNLKVLVQQQIKKLDYAMKQAQQNASIVQLQMKRIQKQMQQQFKQKVDQMKSAFQRSKQQLKLTFTPVIQQSHAVKSSMQQFRFAIWKAFTMYSDHKSSDQNEIMKQLLFMTIVDLCSFRNRIISRGEIDAMSRRLVQHF